MTDLRPACQGPSSLAGVGMHAHAQGVEQLVTEFDAGHLADTRHALVDRLRGEGLPEERLWDFVIAVNECLTNVLVHGGGRGRLRLWRLDAELRCSITDQGHGIPRQRGREPVLPPADAQSGRGMWLVRHLADGATVTTGPDGTAVELALRLPPSG